MQFRPIDLEQVNKLTDDICEIENIMGAPIKKDLETLRALLPEHTKETITLYTRMRTDLCRDLYTKEKLSFN